MNMYPEYLDGETAAKYLGVGEIFYNTTMKAYGRVVKDAGQNLTRGDYGNTYFAEYAINHNHNAVDPDGYNGLWRVWDSDFGWLPD